MKNDKSKHSSTWYSENSRADWFLQSWWGNLSRRRKSLNSNLSKSALKKLTLCHIRSGRIWHNFTDTNERATQEKVFHFYLKSNPTQREYRKRMGEIWTEWTRFNKRQKLVDIKESFIFWSWNMRYIPTINQGRRSTRPNYLNWNAKYKIGSTWYSDNRSGCHYRRVLSWEPTWGIH